MTRRAVMLWSGGKDSTLALEAALADPTLSMERLVTTVTADYDRISMHGVRRALLERQGASLGIPLSVATIPATCTNAVYEDALGAVLRPLAASGVTHVVCGDLYLADIREYRERTLAEYGLTAVFPLWLRDTGALARDFITRGFEAIACCVDPRQISETFAGRRYDAAFLADLPASVDPCGENGEFHTFVANGPIFSSPIPVAAGERVLREGFMFADIALVDA